MPRTVDDVELTKDQIKRLTDLTNEYATQLIMLSIPVSVRRSIGAAIAYRGTYHVKNMTRGQMKELFDMFVGEGE